MDLYTCFLGPVSKGKGETSDPGVTSVARCSLVSRTPGKNRQLESDSLLRQLNSCKTRVIVH